MNEPRRISVPVGDASTTALIYAADASAAAGPTMILAHGAGAGQQSAFMVDTARGLAQHGVAVATFNFLYTEQRRRAPDRAPALEACYLAAFGAIHRELSPRSPSIYIGGKSMGGRIATHLAAARPDLPIAGVVLLGYPLHPPGRPQQRRDAHLPSVHRPVLFVQGSRDAFGTPAELEPVLAAMPSATLHIVEGADHALKNRRDEIVAVVAGWVGRVSAP